MDSNFEIRRKYPGMHISRIFDSTGVRGLALGPDPSDSTKAVVADGDQFLGFLTRDVTTDGPVLADHVYPGRLELPFKSGSEVSLEKADEVEVEGEAGNAGLLVTSGTGAITTGSTVGTALSFSGGKLYAAQGSDQVFYRLSAQLTPVNGGAVRIRAEVVR